MTHKLPERRAVTAVGAMSGTSLDGVDVAAVTTDGHDILEFGESGYRPYSDQERTVLKAALGQWSGQEVDVAKAVVETVHQVALSDCPEAELFGFHGQTLAHEPRGRGTLQVGDGAILARALARPVVWDFRSEDVAQGGEGAPLAPFFHHACARYVGLMHPVCFLNLGGVGNLTWVDPRCAKPEEPDALLAFDTGPANAPIDDLMHARLGQPYDALGALAATGVADPGLIERFKALPYFSRIPPKSLDRDDFAQIVAEVDHLSDAHAVATLTAFCAVAVAQALAHCPTHPKQLLVTGGGRHNATLMAMLTAWTGCTVSPVEVVGLDGDMLEAQAFAYLAVRVARGLPTSAPMTTGVNAPVGGGTAEFSRLVFQRFDVIHGELAVAGRHRLEMRLNLIMQPWQRMERDHRHRMMLRMIGHVPSDEPDKAIG